MSLPLKHIEGKYEILHKIKEGGMGAIYKVRHLLLEEIRVIKVIRPQFAEDQDLQRRFKREAKTAIRLRHPNIAQLYDFAASEGGSAYMVMEYIEGHTLQESLELYGPPSLGLGIDLLQQGLSALDYLHRRGYVHRDISPDNLMMTRDHDDRPMIKLIDLGIVKRLGAEVNLTTTGTFLGKVRYSSPEQFNAETGSAKVDARSDVYSFGLLTYELLTGTFPIVGESFNQLLAGHLLQPPLDFAESDPDGRVVPQLRQIILNALEKNPDDRFESARDFAQRLAPFGEDFASYRHEFNRRMARTDATRRVDMPRPGSTQERLNQQFGVEPTPAPTEPSTPPQPPPIPVDPEEERRRLEAEKAEAERRARESRIAELLAQAFETINDDPEAARSFLQELLKLEPEHIRARDLLDRIDAELEQRRAEQQRLEEERRRAEALETARSEIIDLLDREHLDDADVRLRAAEDNWDASFPDLRERLEEQRAVAERRARIRELTEQARTQAELKEWESVIALTAQVLELEPEHPEVLELQATAEAEIERIEARREAERKKQEAEARRQEAVATARAAIVELLDREDLEAARARLHEAESELDATFPELTERLDDLRALAERRAQAQSLYEDAKDEADAEHWEDAVGLLAQALEHDPEHDEARALRDEAQAEVRRLAEEAERERRLTEAVRDIRRQLDTGDLETASRELDFAVETWGGSPDLVTLARRIDEETRRRERQKALEALLAQAREDRDAGRLEEAQRSLRELLTLQPDHPEARSLLSTVEADIARQEIEKAAAATAFRQPEADSEQPEPTETEAPVVLPGDSRATIPVDPSTTVEPHKLAPEPVAEMEAPTDSVGTPKRQELPRLWIAAGVIGLLLISGIVLWRGTSDGPKSPELPNPEQQVADSPSAANDTSALPVAAAAPAEPVVTPPESEPELTESQKKEAKQLESELARLARSESKATPPPAEAEPPAPRAEEESSPPPAREPIEESDESRSSTPDTPTTVVQEPTPEPSVLEPEQTTETDFADPEPKPSVLQAPPPGPAVSETKDSEPATKAETEPAPPPEPEFQRGDLIKPGPGVQLPDLVNAPKPDYPRQARRARMRSAVRVTVAVLVDENGKVTQALIKQGDDSGLGFNEAALAAARQATFRPATKDGVEGKMWTELAFGFAP